MYWLFSRFVYFNKVIFYVEREGATKGMRVGVLLPALEKTDILFFICSSFLFRVVRLFVISFGICVAALFLFGFVYLLFIIIWHLCACSFFYLAFVYLLFIFIWHMCGCYLFSFGICVAAFYFHLIFVWLLFICIWYLCVVFLF